MSVIICAVDDTPLAGDILDVAAGLAARLGSDLVLAHATAVPVRSDTMSRRAPAEFGAIEAGSRFLRQIAEERGVEGDRRVDAGAAAPFILHLSEALEAMMVVVGAPRRRGLSRAMFGSVWSTLVAEGRCPIVTVPHDRRPTGFETVVCGVDRHRESRPALQGARILTTLLGARLVVIQAIPQVGAVSVQMGGLGTELERTAEADAREMMSTLLDLEGFPSETDRRIERGAPSRALAQAAESEGAGMVVVGTRGRGAFTSALLGSVAGDLCELSPCPVMIVPASAPGTSESPDQITALREGRRGALRDGAQRGRK